MKKITFLFSFAFLFFLSSCKKDDKITYELTLIAKRPSIGTTTFTEITYHNGAQLQTITNSGTDFETTFEVPENYNIVFSVKGNTTLPAGTTGTPIPIVTYQLTEVVNNDKRTTLCDGTSTAVSGSNGKYNFSASFNTNFDGFSCK
jgi:hypothetical protein